jgi:DNA-binding NtrC family response regulator
MKKTSQGRKREAVESPATPPRVLVVDDDYSILSLLDILLKSQNYEVALARSGEAALDILKKWPCALVIADVRMEGMDGIQLLREVRRTYPATAVLILTSFGNVELAVEALKEGALDYMTKPFKIDEFLQTVQRALRHQQELAEDVDTSRTVAAKLNRKYGILDAVDIIRTMVDHLRAGRVVITQDSAHMTFERAQVFLASREPPKRRAKT